MILALALLVIVAVGVSALAEYDPDGLNVGDRDRFWRYHVDLQTLVVNGVDHYHNIQSCLNEKLTPQERNEMETQVSKDRGIGFKLSEPEGDRHVYCVGVSKAMLPVHVKAVQSLAACVREHIPSLYESRAMYQEMDLDEDTGLGGNCPTHLGSLVPIFLPYVYAEMKRTLETAYEAANWEAVVKKDRAQGLPRAEAIPEPKDTGIRASEHLTYSDFPSLAEHTDGSTTYTMNFAFSGPDDYEGGDFYIIENTGEERWRYLKPNKYDALVFLGGRYLHGVAEIKSGHREMFSSELWPYPDMPFGRTLWQATPPNMEDFIERCNDVQEGKGPCNAEFATTTWNDMDLDEVREKYAHEQDGEEGEDDWEEDEEEWDEEDEDEEEWEEEQAERAASKRPNRVRPEPLVPVRFRDATTGVEYDLASDLRSKDEEPLLLVPKNLEPGEMVPIRWRDDFTPVDGSEGETFVIGFPPELHQEFQAYVKSSGMMEVAHKILYDEKPLEREEHRLYQLDDGHKWGAMVQGDWETDMIWLDPADEECFESLLGVLRRGGFDVVLDKVGKAFDLEGLMVQGVGAIFLSEYEVSNNMHNDIPGSKGSFYNIIVPVHIPEKNSARMYVEDGRRKGSINMNPDVGIVLGGESYHGTAECNYKDTKDFRLSFAVYVADINEDNVDLIASDSTSLWPTDGDTAWFWAQQGRLWSKEGNRSLKSDTGRKPLKVEDKHANCSQWKDKCDTDLKGSRLLCPKTCKLYLEDDAYYSMFEGGAFHNPSCPSGNPTCPSGTAQK